MKEIKTQIEYFNKKVIKMLLNCSEDVKKIIATRISNTLWGPNKLIVNIKGNQKYTDMITKFFDEIEILPLMNGLEKELSLHGQIALTMDNLPGSSKIYLTPAKVLDIEKGIVEGRTGIVSITILKQVTNKLFIEEKHTTKGIERKLYSDAVSRTPDNAVEWEEKMGDNVVIYKEPYSMIPVIIFNNKQTIDNEAISDTRDAETLLYLYQLSRMAAVRELKQGGSKLIKFTTIPDGTSGTYSEELEDMFEKPTMILNEGSAMGDDGGRYQYIQANYNGSLVPLNVQTNELLNAVFIAAGYHEVGFGPNLSFQQTRGEIRFENRQEEITVKSKAGLRLQALKNLVKLYFEFNNIKISTADIDLSIDGLVLEMQDAVNANVDPNANPTQNKDGVQ